MSDRHDSVSADVNEPLRLYRDTLRAAHAESVAKHFEDLVRISGVDEDANRETIRRLKHHTTSRTSSRIRKTFWLTLLILLSVIGVSLVIIALNYGGWHLLWLVGSVAIVWTAISLIAPKISLLNGRIRVLQQEIEALTEESWAQMKPVNALFRSGDAGMLAERTFPNLQIDEYFSERALGDFVTTYGLDKSFNEGRSILKAQSGKLFQNPIAITRYLEHWIGERDYEGSLVINWTETITNAKGLRQRVHRTQVLVASVTKPYPEFAESVAILLGHEAAPNLNFSRTPSRLSGLGEGSIARLLKSGALKGIEYKAVRELTSGRGHVTVMSNPEFETLFQALDRSNEIEFRLLFTPLSQQEMVSLLKDDSVGYGDDFTLIKKGRMNFIEAEHLSRFEFDPDPRLFANNDLEAAREFFNSYHNEYFRSVFFGIAPFLAIPLYTEARRLPSVRNSEEADAPNFWEVEAMANEIGEHELSHPDSVTRNLLNAEIAEYRKDGVIASVTALGFEGIERVDYESVFGGDGKWHRVPVPWTEYIPVTQTTPVVVSRVAEERDPNHPKSLTVEGWKSLIKNLGGDESASVRKGSLRAAIIRKVR